jgi:hypothetical protein
MRHRGRIALFASLAVGCGDPDPVKPAPALITVTTTDPPTLIAFRDEATGWRSVAVGAATTFELEVAGPYQVVVVCETTSDTEPRSIGVVHYARTPDDERTIDDGCETRPYPYTVSGRMAELGEVSLENSSFGVTGAIPEWDFELPSRAGTFDLVALYGDLAVAFSHIAIRRDVAVTSDTDVGLLERSAENAQPLVPATFSATNLQPGESTSAFIRLDTRGTITLIQSRSARTGRATAFVPDTVLIPTDRQRIQMTASMPSSDAVSQIYSRGVSRDVRAGDPTSLTLPEPMGPVAFALSPLRLVATWSTLPDHDTLTLLRVNSGGASLLGAFHEITLTRNFLEATGATNAIIDLTDVPGFSPEWHFDARFDQTRMLTAELRTSVSETVSSSAIESTPGSAAAGVPHRDALTSMPSDLELAAIDERFRAFRLRRALH